MEMKKHDSKIRIPVLLGEGIRRHRVDFAKAVFVLFVCIVPTLSMASNDPTAVKKPRIYIYVRWRAWDESNWTPTDQGLASSVGCLNQVDAPRTWNKEWMCASVAGFSGTE